jgi:phospholipid N-methyltransferase
MKIITCLPLVSAPMYHNNRHNYKAYTHTAHTTPIYDVCLTCLPLVSAPTILS